MKLKRKTGLNGWRSVMEAVLAAGIILIVAAGLRKTPHLTPPSSPPLPSVSPIDVCANQFMAGSEVLTNYAITDGEAHLIPVSHSISEGNAAVQQGGTVVDEEEFKPDARVHAAKTWAAPFEPKHPLPPSPLARSIDVCTNQLMVDSEAYAKYAAKSGEACLGLDQPLMSGGEGSSLRQERAEDGLGAKLDAQVYASTTRVDMLELEKAETAPNSVPNSLSGLTNEVFVSPPKPEPIHLVFIGRNDWRRTLDASVGEELVPEKIPAAPDLSSDGWAFSHWCAKEEQAGKYDFGVATTDMPRELVAIYTNLPIRIEYVVDGTVDKRVEWYTKAPVPARGDPEKKGFKFKGWLDGEKQFDSGRYKTNYVPIIRLTAQFEEDGSWPTLTVVVESKGVGLTNSATVRIMKLPGRECVFTQSVDCVGRKDTFMVIKADEYRKLALDVQALAATISDGQEKQVGSLVLLKSGVEDKKILVPVKWTEDELKKADGLCSNLHGLVEKPKELWKKGIQDLLNSMPSFQNIGYDTFCKLYRELSAPEVTPEELKELEEYWPKSK